MIRILNNFEQGGPKMSADEAVMQIGAIRDQAQAMGGNDSELPELTVLMESVASGADVDKALARAQQILASKQDYH